MNKKLFVEIINYIIELQSREKSLEKALQTFSGDTEFTRIHFDTVRIITNWLTELMNDKYKYIDWWLFDTPNAGTGEDDELYSVYVGDKQFTLKTPEDLYDFLTLDNDAPAKPDPIGKIQAQGNILTIQYRNPTDATTQINLAAKAQDNGVRFARQIIQEMRDTNNRTRNDGYEERDALLKYISDKIYHEYLFKAGINRDLNTTGPIQIISILEEEP